MRKTIQFINTHPLNKSKTKQAHSFSKSPRFSAMRQSKYQGNEYFYDLSRSAVQFQPKTSNIIFSKSTRFKTNTNHEKQIIFSPSPITYRSPDFVQVSLKKKRGNAFNKSPKYQQKKQFNPGPGTYQSKNPQQSLGYSIPRQSKLKKYFHQNKLGPGSYDKNDNFCTRSTPGVLFPHSNRFKYTVNNTPAPGQYYQDLRNISLYRNDPKFMFSRSQRLMQNRDKSLSPGPGAYHNQFSEFSERSQKIYNILKRL